MTLGLMREMTLGLMQEMTLGLMQEMTLGLIQGAFHLEHGLLPPLVARLSLPRGVLVLALRSICAEMHLCRALPPGLLPALNLRTTTLHNCAVVPRRARM